MNYGQQITFLSTLCEVLALALVFALAGTVLALIEARRWRSAAATRDPLLAGLDAPPLPPSVARMVDKIRRMGGA
jgi:hypothetical protein